MADDKVVELAARLNGAAPVEMLHERWDACHHRHVTLDDRLRVITCRDCGQDRLDAFEVLSAMAHDWRSWQREIETLRKLRAEYHDNQLATWKRARDRHLGAHPDHAAARFVTFPDGEAWPRAIVEAIALGGWTMPRDCNSCYSLFLRFDRRWVPSRAPEPPSGKLEP